jgi:thermitase
VRIAIVDSGIDLSHPDLAPVLWRNSSGSSGYDFVNFDSDPRDDDGHGTHVAGLAAARGGNSIGISGVMPIGAELMAVKVLDENGDGSYSEVANGIRWATDNGAHVINLSLSGPGPSAIIEDALTYALSRGVFIATAAGNNNVRINESNNFTIPAAYGIRYTGLITVGAIDAITRSRSNFSNFGDYVEIAAPGSNGILSTLPGGIYDFLSGTSMSSPIVAGAAALAIGAFRSMGRPYTVAEIEASITNSATRNPNLNGLVRNSAELSLPRLTDSLKNDSLLSLEGGFRESAE